MKSFPTALLLSLSLSSLFLAGCGGVPPGSDRATTSELPSVAPLSSDQDLAAPAPGVSGDAAAPAADVGGDGGTADQTQDDDGGEAPGPEVTEGATAAPGPDAAPSAAAARRDAPAFGSIGTAPNAGQTRLTRLTAPGCCVQPFWAADSGSVRFIDRPSPDAPAGIWAVGLDQPGAPPQRIVDEIATYTADLAYRIDVDTTSTAITRRADGVRWTVPADGRPISISPSAARIAWQVSPPQSTPENRRTSRVWVANLDGSGAREVASVPRGTLSGWVGEDSLLLRGREQLSANEEVLWVLSLATGERRAIARSERMRGELVAPGGRWVAYYVAQSADPAANGLWIANTAGGAPTRMDASLFGAYRWRDGSRLVIVPLRMGGASHELVEVDASSLAARRLTDPALTPFKIANGDWTLSPDGAHIAFVEVKDKAIWVIDLP